MPRNSFGRCFRNFGRGEGRESPVLLLYERFSRVSKFPSLAFFHFSLIQLSKKRGDDFYFFTQHVLRQVCRPVDEFS